jgi:hypothetical protein
MSDVLWLGGSPCAGKSTVAAVLAARHGLHVYSCDAAFERHAANATTPTLARLRAMTPDDLFLRRRSPMIRDAVTACVEAFPMVLADLAALPPGPPVLAEGMALLPLCIATLGASALPRAAWLVPAPAFQRAHYAQRSWARELVARTRDPAAAFEGWMRRDETSARLVQAQARRVSGAHLVVGSDTTVEAVAAWVEVRLGLAG